MTNSGKNYSFEFETEGDVFQEGVEIGGRMCKLKKGTL